MKRRLTWILCAGIVWLSAALSAPAQQVDEDPGQATAAAADQMRPGDPPNAGPDLAESPLALRESSLALREGKRAKSFRYYVTDTVNRRPMSAQDKRLILTDWRVSRVPINHKGIAIGATDRGKAPAWAFRRITVKNCEISSVWRSGPGIHTDFLRISGGGDRQDVPTSVHIQDVYLHDGDGIPIIIQDGTFDTITLKNIRYRNTTTGIQIATINSGRIGKIIIENCPNMGVAIMGRPGTVDVVYVKNSPGLRLGDTVTSKGRTGVRIIYLD